MKQSSAIYTIQGNAWFI